MNKYIIATLFALSSCSTTKIETKKILTKNIKECLDSDDLLKSANIQPKNLLFLAKNGDNRDLYQSPNDSLNPYDQKKYYVEYNKFKDSVQQQIGPLLTASYKNDPNINLDEYNGKFTNPRYDVDAIRDFIYSYLSVCEKSQIQAFEHKDKSYFIIDKNQPTLLEESDFIRTETLDTKVFKSYQTYVNELYNEYKDEKNAYLISLNKIASFKMSFTYPELTGLSKAEASEDRRNLLATRYKQVLFHILNLSSNPTIDQYLSLNTPLPINAANATELKEKYNKLRTLIDEETDPSMAYARNKYIDKTFEEISTSYLSNEFYLEENPDSKYATIINNLVSSQESRKKIFSQMILWASNIEISRSEDKKQVIFNIEINLPKIFETFKFNKISNYIE